MKSIYKWIACILILALIIWQLSKNKKSFNRVNIQTTNIVSNQTDRNYLDSIVYVGLNELNLDSVVVTIKDIDGNVKENFNSNLKLKAEIIGKARRYFIFLDEMGRDEAIKVLSHELIHLKQRSDNRYIANIDNIVWDKKVLDVSEVNSMIYEERPWEAEAFAKQNELENKIRKVLYSE